MWMRRFHVIFELHNIVIDFLLRVCARGSFNKVLGAQL